MMRDRTAPRLIEREMVLMSPELMGLVLKHLCASDLSRTSSADRTLAVFVRDILLRRAMRTGIVSEDGGLTARQLASLHVRHEEAYMPVAAGDIDASFFVTSEGTLMYSSSIRAFECLPVSLFEGIRLRSVFCRGGIWAAVTTGGEVYMFLTGQFVESAVGGVSDVLPFRMPSTMCVISLAVGSNHCVAVAQNGELLSWGQNAHGQCGHGMWDNEYSIPRVVDGLSGVRVLSAAAGSMHSLVVTEEGTVYSFGCGEFGQLGHGAVSYGNSTSPMCQGGLENAYSPRVVVFDATLRKRMVAVSAGKAHSLSLCVDGSVFAWGDNKLGQLGMSDCLACIGVPQWVGYLGGASGMNGINKAKVCGIVAGWENSFAITGCGELFHWGLHRTELDVAIDGDLEDLESLKYFRCFPKAVHGIAEFVAVAVSSMGSHTIVVTRSGHVYGCVDGIHASPSTWIRYEQIQCTPEPLWNRRV